MTATARTGRERSSGGGHTGWMAGFAEGDMTPPAGCPMGGFGRERFSKGTIAPLRAQALALQDADGRRGIILTADILAFDPVIRDLLRSRLNVLYGIEPAGVLLCPSHTHWGPTVLYRINFCVGLPDVYTMRRMTQLVCELADRAFQSLTPASVEYTALDTAIGHNRRLPLADGRIGWGPHTEGHYDTHTPILRIRRQPPTKAKTKDPDGMQTGTHTILLAGHACHPTATGTTPRWSPDYPGAMRDTLEAQLGDGCRAMFVMGCGANAKVTHMDPASGLPVFTNDPRRSKQAGQKLARSVLKHLESATCIPLPASLAVRRASASLPLARRLDQAALRQIASDDNSGSGDLHWARQSLAFPDQRMAHEYETVAWILGHQLTIFGLPDEVCSPIGPRTRAQALTPYAMTIAYANSSQCYIPTNTIVREGGYEGFSSHRAYFMPAPFSPRIDKAYTALIKRLVDG